MTEAQATGDRVRVAQDAADNGLAHMVASLIEQNLADHPERLKTFERMRGRVVLIAQDADVAITLRFRDGGLLVQHGIVGLPDVTVRASSDDVVQMSLVETGWLGLPDPRGPEFRKLLRAARSGRVQVFVGLAGLPLALRLTRLMSVEAAM